MTLIEGIGDEVIHFFITLFVVIVVSLAWWTTNISEQRHVRTVLLLERRRRRNHHRLTNHTEAVTITEGTNALTPVVAEESTPDSVTSVENSADPAKPPEATTSSSVEAEEENQIEIAAGEEEAIIETMDADTCVVRQRRLAFYDNFSSEENEDPSNSQSQASETVEQPETSSCSTTHSQSENNIDEDKSGIRIKLKYINDDLKMVNGHLEESLESFKKRHFHPELSANKLVRLIFNGQVLQPDTQTLKKCGLFDNCVVHCLIHKKRPQSNDEPVSESRSEGYSFPNTNPIGNNNNQNRDWDLGNFLFALISLILLLAWYFRYVYAHMYTVTATVGLILITGIFTIVLVGMYFPDNENYPNPRFHIARERVQPQQ